MSLLPVFEVFYSGRPCRLLDQHFGMGLDQDDLLTPFTIPQEINRLITVPSFGYLQSLPSRNGPKGNGSEISMDKDKFEVNLDVQHFSPDEITVKAAGDNTITVEAKHEEKRDEHGYISRQFVRKYVLPKDHDIKQVQSKLSSDGVLTIMAPKVNTEAIEDRKIPIQHTRVPSKSSIEKKVEEEKKNEDRNALI